MMNILNEHDFGSSPEIYFLGAGKRGKPIGRLIYSEIACAKVMGVEEKEKRVKVMVHHGRGVYEVNYSFAGCGGIGIYEPLIKDERKAIRIAKKLANDLERKVEYISGTRLERVGRLKITT